MHFVDYGVSCLPVRCLNQPYPMTRDPNASLLIDLNWFNEHEQSYLTVTSLFRMDIEGDLILSRSAVGDITMFQDSSIGENRCLLQ